MSDSIDAAVEAINDLRKCEGNRVVLKREQLLAVKNLLNGKDVLAVLPTGFGKSMIFTVFSFAKRELLKRTGQAEAVIILVVSSLKSLIEDQIMELRSLSCSAEYLKSENLPQISESPPQFIYCTAEKAIDKDFFERLKTTRESFTKALPQLLLMRPTLWKHERGNGKLVI